MAKWDVFISYASEDRRSLAEPLAGALEDANLSVWYDQQELKVGDPLHRRINEGLADSRFGVVIVSPDFVAKDWPQSEFAAIWERDTMIPVVHRMTTKDITEKFPLLAGRVYVHYDGRNLRDVVEKILDRVGAAVPSANVAVDFTHEQDEWWHLSDSFRDTSKYAQVGRSGRGMLVDDEVWRNASVLVVPPPHHTPWVSAEIDALVSWVNSGGGLLLLGYYAGPHHETNMNDAAWAFGFEFRRDLLTPAGSTMADREISSRSPDRAVSVSIPAESMIGEGVGEVFALHACSVASNSTDEPAIRISTPQGTQSWRPIGRVNREGHQPNIAGYSLDRLAPSPEPTAESPQLATIDLVLATTYGKGRVAVAGTWKLFTVHAGGNERFVSNLLEWLAN